MTSSAGPQRAPITIAVSAGRTLAMAADGAGVRRPPAKGVVWVIDVGGLVVR